MSPSPKPATEFSPLELGWGQVCLSVKDIKASLDFYGTLGFTMVGGKAEEGWAILNNATSEIGLFKGHITGPMLNFRGIDIQQLAAAMKLRGFSLEGEATFKAKDWPPEWAQDAQGKPLPPEGSGSFTIKDPDGVALFFDTVPVERALYKKGQRFCETKITGELMEGQQHLGRLEYCINTKDAKASCEFYQLLGLTVITDGLQDNFAVVGCKVPHQFSVGLYQGHIGSNLLNFRGGDVFAIAERLAAAGLKLKLGPEKEADGSNGLWLDDPDGHSIYFNTSPGEKPR